MIAYLSGTLLRKSVHQGILLTQGVGYLVSMRSELLEKKTEGENLSLFIHTQVKDDDIALFGFESESELSFFKLLLTVSGIGPKTAMGILKMPVDLVRRAIAEGNQETLQSIPGLGKKTAARLILELKSKMDDLPLLPSEGTVRIASLEEEALEALLHLGYEKGKILRFFHEEQKSYARAEDLVTSFLQAA